MTDQTIETNDQLATLIRDYMAANNASAIITLVESLKSARDRAEAKVDGYLHEIKLLSQRYAAITEPATGRTVTEGGKTERQSVEMRMTNGEGRDSEAKQKQPQPTAATKSKPLTINIDL